LQIYVITRGIGTGQEAAASSLPPPKKITQRQFLPPLKNVFFGGIAE